MTFLENLDDVAHCLKAQAGILLNGEQVLADIWQDPKKLSARCNYPHIFPTHGNNRANRVVHARVIGNRKQGSGLRDLLGTIQLKVSCEKLKRVTCRFNK